MYPHSRTETSSCDLQIPNFTLVLNGVTKERLDGTDTLTDMIPFHSIPFPNT
jgi:hypothetical protein